MELKLRLTWFDKQAESFIDICKCECFIEFYIEINGVFLYFR